MNEMVRAWQSLPLAVQGPVNQDGVGPVLFPIYAVPVDPINMPMGNPHPHGLEAEGLIEEP
jgi:hypothetical protein